MTQLRLVHKITILPDPRLPKYKPNVKLGDRFLAWLFGREFSFIKQGDAIYCNPMVFELLRRRFYGE